VGKAGEFAVIRQGRILIKAKLWAEVILRVGGHKETTATAEEFIFR